jgi:peptidoglycan/LPS O-acetylase OafA/YrhL
MRKINELLNISNINRISFRKDINGLRAIAVLAVVFYHADIEFFKGGWLGVDVFFVISGYLISNIIIAELNHGKFSFKNFYLRRAKRILPALFATLLLSLPFAYFLLTPKAMEEFIESTIASLFFFANYHFMGVDFYIAESSKLMPLLHTWSLAIEEQYYILFPLFAFTVFKLSKRYFSHIVILLSFFSIYLNTTAEGSDKFYLLQYRVWELLLGVIIMILSSNLSIKHLEKVGLPLLLFPFFYFDDASINETEPKLIALFGISLIIFSNTENTFTTKLLSVKPLTKIGLSSYSIYLLHQPMFAFFRIFEENYNLLLIKDSSFKLISFDIFNYVQLNFDTVNSQVLGIRLFVLLTLGYLFYKNIELKLLKVNYLIFIFIAISSFVFWQTNSINTFIADENSINNVTEEEVFTDYNCWRRLDSLSDSIEKLDGCVLSNDADKYLLIIGDSSSVALHKNISKNYFKNTYNYIFVSMNFESFFKSYNDFSNCSNCFFEWMKKNKTNITTVVSVELHRFIELEGIYKSPTSILRSSETFLSNMSILSSVSNSTIFIEPFPTLHGDIHLHPKDVLYASTNSLEEIYIPLNSWNENIYRTSNLLTQLIETNENLHLLETQNLFCDEESNKCIVYERPNLYYLDRVHLSIEGGGLIVDELFKFINNFDD